MVYWLIRLHKAMRQCHKSCEKYYEAKSKEATQQTELDVLRDNWLSTINEIGNVVEEIDTTLEILSPETRAHIGGYVALEAMVFYDGIETLNVISDEFQKPLEFNIEKIEVSTSFEDAVKRLQELIRHNYTADEIHRASHLVNRKK
ncbi:MAG: hypothetical protein R2867_32350 [Caldilineaceae bacterium]